MNKKIMLSLMLITGLLLVLAACAPAAEATPAAVTDNSGGSTTIDAKALVETQCTQCHALSKIENEKADTAGWTKIVDRMIAKGSTLKLSESEKGAVIEYLATTYK